MNKAEKIKGLLGFTVLIFIFTVGIDREVVTLEDNVEFCEQHNLVRGSDEGLEEYFKRCKLHIEEYNARNRTDNRG